MELHFEVGRLAPVLVAEHLGPPESGEAVHEDDGEFGVAAPTVLVASAVNLLLTSPLGGEVVTVLNDDTRFVNSTWIDSVAWSSVM